MNNLLPLADGVNLEKGIAVASVYGVVIPLAVGVIFWKGEVVARDCGLLI